MSVFKAYIAGPMSGIPKFNFPAFEEAAKYIRATHGWHVVSPHELDDPATREWAEASEDGQPGGRWGEFLGRDLELIRNGGISIIVLLPGWQNSQGARLEASLGLDCGCQFWRLCRRPVKLGQDVLTLASCRTRDIAAMVRPEVVLPASSAVIEEIKASAPEELFPPAPAIPYAPPLPDLLADAAMPEWEEDYIEPEDREEGDPDPRADTARGEERVTDPETGGAKGSKPQRTDLLPPEFLLGLAEVYGTGAKKYSEFNYALGYPWRLSLGAMQRHVLLWAGGQSFDEETGHHHLLHAAWHCACLYQFETFGKGTDDRMRWDDPEWPGEEA